MANREPLYPPIVDTMIPVFETEIDGVKQNARFYFDLSPFQQRSSSNGDNKYYYYSARENDPREVDEKGYYKSTYSIQSIANTVRNNTTILARQFASEEISYHQIVFRDTKMGKGKYNYNLFSYAIAARQLDAGQWMPGQYYRVQARLTKDPVYYNSVPSWTYDDSLEDIFTHNVLIEKEESSQENCTLHKDAYGFKDMAIKYLSDLYKNAANSAKTSGSQENPLTLLRQVMPRKRECIDWLEENNFVSEWSTVVLVKSIYSPEWVINSQPITENSILTFGTPLINIIGRLTIPEDGLEPETLKKIRVKTTTLSGELIDDSGDISLSTQNIDNSFSYKIKKMLDKANYSISIYAETRNGWSGTLHFTANVEPLEGSFSNILLSCSEDDPRGQVDLTVSTTEEFKPVVIGDGEEYDCSFAVIRTDSTTNFSEWEELNIIVLEEGAHIINTQDVTTESGIQYWYGLQAIENATGSRSSVYIVQEDGSMKEAGEEEQDPKTLFPFYDGMFLSNAFGHLAISFGESVTSYSNNIREAQIETIGSQFPYFYRNDIVNYRTLSLSGTISYNDNNEELVFSKDCFDKESTVIENNNLVSVNVNKGFRTKEQLFKYDRVLDNYTTFNGKNRINNLNDITLEREYRKAVMSFLQSGNSFLLKTAAEGNVLVRLTDMTFTPKTELDNLVYDFTCTAVELDDCTVDNYNKYNIQYLAYTEEEGSGAHVYTYTAYVTEVGLI